MSTFIKAKLEKSDDQTNIDNYRVASNITEYHIPKFIIIRQLIHEKIDLKMSKINMFKMDIRTVCSDL